VIEDLSIRFEFDAVGRTSTRVDPSTFIDASHPDLGYLFAPLPAKDEALEEVDLTVDVLALRRLRRRAA
jgi:hypothetical protein